MFLSKIIMFLSKIIMFLSKIIMFLINTFKVIIYNNSLFLSHFIDLKREKNVCKKW
jgi:hypothetical protein